MAEKIAKLSLQRDVDFMYFIKKGDVWRVPRKKPGQPKGKNEKVAAAGVDMDYGKYIYFLDGDGDIARQARQGSRKPSKKKATAAPGPKKASRKKAAKLGAKKPATKGAARGMRSKAYLSGRGGFGRR